LTSATGSAIFLSLGSGNSSMVSMLISGYIGALVKWTRGNDTPFSVNILFFVVNRGALENPITSQFT
jgi:hypothetical protein